LRCHFGLIPLLPPWWKDSLPSRTSSFILAAHSEQSWEA
jgi:hypothetical protein